MKTINKKIFLDELPRRKEGIDWVNSVGMKVHFIYDDIEDDLLIENYRKNGQEITISYNNRISTIKTCVFLKGSLGKLLGKITNEFKIKIGTTFKDNKRDLTIIDKKYRKNKNGKDYKWYKYHCNKCNAELWIEESNLLKGSGCSCCRGYIAIKGINDISTKRPDLLKYFANIENAYTYTYASGEKVLLKCPDCGTEKYMRISDLSKKGFSCKQCSDGISKPNKIMYNTLKQLNVNFESEKRFEWCKFEYNGKQVNNSRYDFYLPSKCLIIEMDGSFHYNDNKMSMQTKEDSQYIDDMKNKMAKNIALLLLG